MTKDHFFSGHKKLIAVSALAGLCAFSAVFAVGCSSSGVAATVNGKSIQESDVTDYIESYRSVQSLTDTDSWGSYLASNSLTPETFRSDEVISGYFVPREILKQGFEEYGIKSNADELNETFDSVRSNFSSEKEWQEALTSAGMTEETYREELDFYSREERLAEALANEAASDNSEVELQYAKQMAAAYDGAKRSSHILFEASDSATAEEVLNKINSGELDFAEAAKQYSTDTATAEEGGDVGWDKEQSLVSEYTTALAGLEKGQVSGLVTSSYGIHIIKCTDVFTAPETITGLDQLPEEWAETIREYAQSQNTYTVLSEWLEKKQSEANIVINPMPENASYAIEDMSKYTSAVSSSSSSSDTTSSTSTDTTATQQ